MNNLVWVAFITGLTTGGISCMAVQGGLLTTSLAGQIEADLGGGKRKGKQQAVVPAQHPQLARPILLFLVAKLVAYTILGFLLGALGSVLALTPLTRGILQIAIAVFMVGNGLRMLDLHPIFRYFNFEPPAAVRRFIRQKSKDSGTAVTPLFLGFLTVLIPCGVTQSMMAVAVGTGVPMAGAMIMLSFVLGTTPVFFGLVYLATKLGSLLEKWFVRLVAAALLILGVVTLDAGLNLVGSPFTFGGTFSQVVQAVSPSSAAGLQTLNTSGSDPSTLTQNGQVQAGKIDLKVTDNGYFPRLIQAPAGQKFSMNLVTSKTTACSRAFVIPNLNYSVLLPETGSQTVEIPAQPAGTRMGFTCSMGMYTGEIVFQ